VQHALLWNMASEMLTIWGPARTARVSPVDRGWPPAPSWRRDPTSCGPSTR
jgi:hypothetical protein